MDQSQFYYDFAERIEPGGFWLDEEYLSRAFCNSIPPAAADLFDVVMSVYEADRRSLRNYKGKNTGQRKLRIRLGLRDPKTWARTDVIDGLMELLYWVSEDTWSFDFVERSPQLSSTHHDQFLFPLPAEQPVTVSLFSGGLDSLAGVAARALDHADKTYVLVSGYTHQRLRHQQELQVRGIKSAWQDGSVLGNVPEIRHLAVPFGVEKPSSREEKGQRTRALVFLALGTAAALQAQTDTLWVYENGIGALNLPLNQAQLGVDNYRGVHPRTLVMASDLFNSVLDGPINILNPYLFRTKSELCKSLIPGGLASLARETVSCDRYPLRIRKQPQCGVCTSCVLRRQALYCGELAEYDPDEGYRRNIAEGKRFLSETDRYGVEAMVDQAHRLGSCLDSDIPWASLTSLFPEMARTQQDLIPRSSMTAEELQFNFEQLIGNYVLDWKHFLVAL